MVPVSCLKGDEEMLIQLRFDEIERDETNAELHGEFPKTGSIIEIQGESFAVAAVPTSWVSQGEDLIPVIHLRPKLDDAPA